MKVFSNEGDRAKEMYSELYGDNKIVNLESLAFSIQGLFFFSLSDFKLRNNDSCDVITKGEKTYSVFVS